MCFFCQSNWAIFLFSVRYVKIRLLIFWFSEVYEEDLYGKIMPLNMPVLYPTLLSKDLEALPILIPVWSNKHCWCLAVLRTENFPFVNTELRYSQSLFQCGERISLSTGFHTLRVRTCIAYIPGVVRGGLTAVSPLDFTSSGAC